MGISLNVHYNGTGLGSLLFVLFVGLKLTGVITWSWWFVTLPLWLPVVLVAALFIIGLGVVVGLD
jgi:uncharacterized protein (DUF983 family)